MRVNKQKSPRNAPGAPGAGRRGGGRGGVGGTDGGGIPEIPAAFSRRVSFIADHQNVDQSELELFGPAGRAVPCTLIHVSA